MSGTAPRPDALLSGADAAAAREALASLLDDLSRSPRTDHPGDLALQALLAEYVRRAGPAGAGERALEAAGRLPALEDAIERLGEADMGFALHRGFTEVAWTVAHLRRGDPSLDELLAGVDEALLELLDSPWEGPFDLAFGLAGIGAYALERWPSPAAESIVGGVIRQLDALARPSGPGRALRTPPAIADLYGVPPALLPSFSASGYHELGMAHGAAGPVAMLARAVRVGAGQGSRRLLEDLVAWLAGAPALVAASAGAGHRPGHWPGGGPAPSFPGRLSVDLSAREDHARASWCKGDPGIALALLHAGRALGRHDLWQQGLDTARMVAGFSRERAALPDACVCHGELGLGHLLRRFHEASGDHAFREAATRWTRAALSRREPGRGTGGFVARFHRDDGSVYEAQDSSFLTGAVGIGLALSAAVSTVDPAWDSLLLANPGAMA